MPANPVGGTLADRRQGLQHLQRVVGKMDAVGQFKQGINQAALVGAGRQNDGTVLSLAARQGQAFGRIGQGKMGGLEDLAGEKGSFGRRRE